MKVRASIRSLAKQPGSKVVRRRGHTYVTRKNRRNTPDRLVLRKFDPVVRRHVEYKESR